MSEFEINITYNGKTENFGIGKWDEFPEAAKQAEWFLKEKGIDGYVVNSLKAVNGEYKGKMIKGENIASLYITKEEILEALQNERIGITYQDGSMTAYMVTADNYFYFDSNFINELTNEQLDSLKDNEIADLYLKEHTSYEIAEKIHDCLEGFITEFPMEYWLYKLCLTNDNANDTIKLEPCNEHKSVDFSSR